MIRIDHYAIIWYKIKTVFKVPSKSVTRSSPLIATEIERSGNAKAIECVHISYILIPKCYLLECSISVRCTKVS